MSERYNPMASMSVVPRSRPVKDGVVGEEMGYTSDFGVNDFPNYEVEALQSQRNFNQVQRINNFTPSNIDSVNISNNGDFNAFSAIEQAQMSSLEMEADLEVKLEREDPEVVAAFQGVIPNFKYEDLEPSVQEVTLIGDNKEIPVIDSNESSIFGFMNVKNNKSSTDKHSENVNFSNSLDLSSIKNRLEIVEKNVIYLRNALDEIKLSIKNIQLKPLNQNNFSEARNSVAINKKSLGSLIKRSK